MSVEMAGRSFFSKLIETDALLEKLNAPGAMIVIRLSRKEISTDVAKGKLNAPEEIEVIRLFDNMICTAVTKGN